MYGTVMAAPLIYNFMNDTIINKLQEQVIQSQPTWMGSLGSSAKDCIYSLKVESECGYRIRDDD